jgi:hypothetical protein
MPGHCSDDLALVTTEKEQPLLHSLRPARTCTACNKSSILPHYMPQCADRREN